MNKTMNRFKWNNTIKKSWNDWLKKAKSSQFSNKKKEEKLFGFSETFLKS